MINAENAHKIISLYESDYDDFLKGLKKKSKKKKDEAAAADKTVKEAEQRKPGHLKEKAKNLLDKAGGIEGAKATIQNVMKFIKPSAAPSDYALNVGQDDKGEADKKKTKVPSVVWYAGGAVLLLASIYMFTQMNKPKIAPFNPAFVPQPY